MNSDIVINYKNRKKRILLDYCKILEQIISLDNNSLWKTGKEFTNICRGILDIFVENNYFDNNYNRDNPVEYLNSCSNVILMNIVDYNKANNKEDMSSKKSETFLLSVIIGSACYIDVVSNIVDGNYSLLKTKFDTLLSHLAKTNFLKVNLHDKVIINRLNDKLKRNILEEKKFFEQFDDLANHNSYQLINNSRNYYLVKFLYNIPNIEKYDKKLVEKYSKLYKDKYLNISYELLIILLLKENLLNKKVNTYLVPLPTTLSSKLLKKLKEPAIRNHIKFIIPLEKASEKKNIKDKLNKSGINVIYYYNGGDGKLLDESSNIEVLCRKEIIESKVSNLDKWHQRKIEIVRTNMGVETREDTILGIKEA